MPETARRRPRAVNQPERSHDEIYQLIEDSSLKADQAFQASAEIKALLEGLTAAIGSESQDEYGKPVGTGIVGRLMRLERDVAHRFGKFDGWIKMLTGGGIALGVIGPVLWWLMGDRLALLLK